MAIQSKASVVLAGVLGMLLAGCNSVPVESGIPLAPKAPVKEIPGYLTAPAGGPLKDAHGRCWRTADWRPILAIEECDPALVRERKAAELALALAAVAPMTVPQVTATAVPGNAAEGAAGAAGSATGDAGVAGSATASAAQAAAAAAASAAGLGGAAPMGKPLVESGIKPGYITKPVVLNTDAAFFFGKDRLTAAGKEAVENLAAYIKLWGIEEVQVEVVGHSDRIGNPKDNLALSKRRAEAVQQVLVEAGVPAAAISATGVGSSQPVTSADTCPDDLVRCDLINCLAPDRRVEVGLKGTRKAPVR